MLQLLNISEKQKKIEKHLLLPETFLGNCGFEQQNTGKASLWELFSGENSTQIDNLALKRILILS